MEATGSIMEALKARASAFGNELLRIFSNPIILGGILIGIVAKLIQGVFELDKNITNTANSLAISKDSAQGLYKNFEKISLYSKNYTENLDNAFLSISNQGKALNDLNSSFQSSVLFTNATVQNQIL